MAALRSGMQMQSQQISPQFLTATLPAKPYCADSFEGGLLIRDRSTAVKKAYLAPNHPHNRRWLVFDVDRETDNGMDWIERGVAPPNFAVVNPDNGHAHYVYILTTPVYMQRTARERPKLYLQAVEEAMTEQLGADRAYSKLMTKNPLHSRWRYIPFHCNTYSLKELALGLTLKKRIRRQQISLNNAEGRNCAVFHALRFFAYSERRKQHWSEESWQRAIRRHAELLNRELAIREAVRPLPLNEIKTIAKSVAAWTAAHLSFGFRRWGDARRQKSLEVRKRLADKRRAAIYSLKARQPGISNRALAGQIGCSETTVRNALRYAHDTADTEPCPAHFVISDDSLLERADMQHVAAEKPAQTIKPNCGFSFNRTPPARYTLHQKKPAGARPPP
jgi:hypothetical protein